MRKSSTATTPTASAIPSSPASPSRPLLSPERSLGSVIKLLTPNAATTPTNTTPGSAPSAPPCGSSSSLVKRYYKPEWGDHWRDHFSVDIINGTTRPRAHLPAPQLVTNYLRVGFTDDGTWRTFGLRKDFTPAKKIQIEDDITASMVVPREPRSTACIRRRATRRVKFVKNCEDRLFQRPDDAIHRGYDKQTESDFASPDNSSRTTSRSAAPMPGRWSSDAIGFEQFTAPMRKMLSRLRRGGQAGLLRLLAHPRLVDGKPTKNPRYLQIRPDLEDPRAVYLAHARQTVLPPPAA